MEMNFKKPEIKLPDGYCSDEVVDLIENEEKEERKQSFYKKSGVGSKYFDKRLRDFDAYCDELKKIVNKVALFISDIKQGLNRSLWLCGENGNGKTMLGAIITRECWGTFRESSRIEDEIEETKHFSSKETLTQLRERYAGYSLLVIDEVGRFPSDNEKKYLFKIINDRYNAERPTVLISNMSRKGLVEYLGKGATDRFIENCTSVSFSCPSYREKERNKIEGVNK